jgi:transcriptional regulator with XRE-family HTH domain
MRKDPKKALRANLDRLLSNKRLSLRTLAERSGLPLSTVHYLSRADLPNPELSTLDALARGFDLDAVDLLRDPKRPTRAA